MSVPILTAKLRAKDETGRTLRTMRSNIGRSLGSIGRMAAGILARDVVRGFVSATREGAMLAGQVQTLQAAFTRFTQAAGVEEMTLDKLRRAVQGTVGDVGLLTAANNAMALGLPVDRMNDLFSAAMSVGHAMGRTTLQAVNDVATGIGRQSRLILDNLGIIVNAEYAQKQYAAALGKVASELTEQERKQAFIGAAMEKLMQKAVLLEGTTSDLQISYEQWGASIENLKRKLGEIFLPILVDVTNAMLGIITTTEDVIESIAQGDWEGAWQKVSDAFKDISFNIRAAIPEIDFDEIAENLWISFATAIGNLSSLGTSFWEWFSDIDWKTDVFDKLDIGLADFFETYIESLAALTSSFAEWLGKVNWDVSFQPLVDAFQAMVESDMMQFIKEQFEKLWPRIAIPDWAEWLFKIAQMGSTAGQGTGREMGGPGGITPSPSSPLYFSFHVQNLYGTEDAARILGEQAADYAWKELLRRGLKP